MTEIFYVRDDIGIRNELVSTIVRPYAIKARARVVEELSVLSGAARVDVAVIGRTLVGFEIKSDGDTLRRLPEQIRAYNLVFDQVNLVTGYKHAYEAIRTVPEWWGVILAHRNHESSVELQWARKPSQNRSQDPMSLASLLWRDEALALLKRKREESRSGTRPRSQILDSLVEETSIQELRQYVCQCLSTRQDWRFDSVST